MRTLKSLKILRTSLGREFPDYIEGYGEVKPFQGALNDGGTKLRKAVKLTSMLPGDLKVLKSLEEAFDRVNINEGMTISFHHHLRNGDQILNRVVEGLAKRGVKALTIAASAIFPVHAPLVEYIKSGVVTGIVTNYMSGPVAEAVSNGELKKPAIMQTHGGRARAIESGDLHIDVAFIAAPTADTYGNINGVYGKSACGTLGYAVADAEYAAKTIVITDNLVPYPACPIEISQIFVDYVVQVEAIGDPKGIVSGTTKITKDPVALIIAKMATEVIKASGLVKEGMSFQTGAGGTSLAVAAELKAFMKRERVVGSFAAGGITGYLVEMLEEGLFKTLFDASLAVQAMLYEASCTPSPGLVSQTSSGAHTDMNYFTFLDSATSLINPLIHCTEAGFSSRSPREIFQQLRRIGKLGEQQMLAKTSGVNTHKGMLFLLGICCAAGGKALFGGTDFLSLPSIIKAMTSGLVERELNSKLVEFEFEFEFKDADKVTLTNGERLFLRYKVEGIRGEVQKGLPTVFDFSLGFYKAN